MVNWQALLEEEIKEEDHTISLPKDDWRREIAQSLCELYYTQYRSQRGYGYVQQQRVDLRAGSDFNRFMESYMSPLIKFHVWEALFPNRESATSSGAIDEALHLLADTKLVDRIYSGDTITVDRIVGNIRKKRAKFLDLL